jgi:CUB/sushi domain-containing protein
MISLFPPCLALLLWLTLIEEKSAAIVNCGGIPPLINGKVHVINTTYGSRVNFTCQDGYNLTGASSAVCLANNTWSNQMPRCTSLCGSWNIYDGSCYQFYSISISWYIAIHLCQAENAFLVTINNLEENEFIRRLSRNRAVWIGLNDISKEGQFVWESESKSSFRRWAPHEPNDKGSEDCVHMRADASDWNDLTCYSHFPYVCERAYRCVSLKAPLNGNITKHGVTAGSMASFTCNEGYSLIGTTSVTCQMNYLWSNNAPTCRIVDCGGLPLLVNGKVHIINTTYGSRVSFTCQNGYNLTGASSAICLANGTWSEEMPSCISPVCYDWTVFNYSCYKFYDHPAQLEFAESICRNHSGHLTSINSDDENEFLSTLADQDIWLGLEVGSDDITADSWLDGSPVAYSNWSGRDPNYQHKGQLGILQVGGPKTGEWQLASFRATFPYVCKKAYRCGRLKAPRDGRVSRHNVTIGSTAQFSCNEGFNLVGITDVVCQRNSLWSSNTPTCKIIDCGELPSLVNGTVRVISTIYGSRINFTCQDSYILIGAISAVCLVNGSWSNHIPLCTPVDCGALPTLVNGKVHVISTSRVNFTCQDGHVLKGNSSSVCLTNGSWSNQRPQCTAVDCGNLYDPVNGKVDVISTTYLSRVNFTCRQGYDLNGASSAECLHNGTWSKQTPLCTSECICIAVIAQTHVPELGFANKGVDVKEIQNTTTITDLSIAVK